MNDREIFEAIVRAARVTNKKIKKLTKDHGTYGDPVNTDIVKTLKAMFFEEVVELLKKKER